MSQLLLVLGLENEVSTHELVSYLKAICSIQNVWMDPYGKPRAVVLCDKKLELRDFKIKSNSGSTLELAIYLDTAKPTTSVFVKTYNSLAFGVKDKLKYLFTSQKHGGQKVVKVEQLGNKDDDCYELFFLKWDDVLKICNRTWLVEKQTLTVIPFFDSFKEPFKQQLKRLIEINTTATQAKRGDTHFVSQKETSVVSKSREISSKVSSYVPNASVKAVHHSENLEFQPVFSRSSSVSDFATDEEDRKAGSAGKQTYPRTGSKDNLKSAKPVLEHPYILTLLHLLKFEITAQLKYSMVTVTINESNWEVEITGPVAPLKIIQKLLTEEDERDHPALIETFLGNEGALQDLKTFIDSAGLYVDIVNPQGKPLLQVTDGEERKTFQETFHDFILTLVISKECNPLPRRECQMQLEWTGFLKSFEDTYTHQHIFVEDTSVTLVCLASESQEMDIMVKIINNVISQLKRDLKPGAHEDESVHNPDHQTSQKSKMLHESSQSSGNTNYVGRKESSKFKKTICFGNSVLLWILNILNLKNGLKQITSDLDVDIDEDEGEIFISGSKEMFQKLKSVLLKEDKKFQFTEKEQALLCDQIIRKSLQSCLISHGCCIVLNDNLEIFVASKDGQEVQFRNFLTSFIQFKTLSHLPEKYQQTKEWKSLVEHFKNKYPHHHIITADDNEVILLSIAPDEKNTEAVTILKELDTAITALTSPVPPEKHLSFTEEIGDQKFEGLKIDNSKKSAADKKSTQKVTLCYKHPVLLRILQTLQLTEAAHKFGVGVTISTDEIIIEGPKKVVRSLESVLIKEDNEMPFEDEETFLTDEQIQQNLDSCLKASRTQLLLDENNLELFVVTKSGEKAKFRNFLTSFIQFKTFSHLPEKYQQTKEWKSLVEHFKNKYPHHHVITTDDNELILLSIAPDEKNTEAFTILKELDTAITALTSPVPPEKHLSFTEEIDDQKLEVLKIDNSKKSAADKKSTQKVTLCYKHPVLLRILQNLQLTEAAHKFGVGVTISTDEIIIEGPKKVVRSLESVLIKEDNEMPFEDEETFLTDEKIQQNLDSCLKDSKTQLLLDENNLELFVLTKSGEKAKFRNFLTSFIQFKTLSHLPEKYQRTKEWKSLVEHFKNKYPHHHIITADDNELILLSIAPDEKTTEAVTILKELDTAITALTSPVPPEKHLSCTEEIGDQKFEGLKIEYSKKSAADKKSTQKVTLCYKHPVLLRILQNLQLTKAVHKFGVGVSISTDEIIIEGPKKAVRSLESVLIKEDNEMPFEDQEEFFTDPRVCQHLDTCLKDSRACLILDDNFEMFVVTKSGDKEQFRTFITRLIRFQKCADMPEKYHNDPTWKTKLQQFEKQNPPHLILNNGEEVYLLTISSNDESQEAKMIMQRINKAILGSCVSHDSDLSGEDEHYDHDFIIKHPKIKIRYFQRFLTAHIEDIHNKWKSFRSKVTLNDDIMQISSSSNDTTDEIASQLNELLSTIKSKKKILNFPGLPTFLNSTGSRLIQHLQEQFRCLIEVSDVGNSHPQHLSLNEEQSSESSRLDYKVIFLVTANFSGFSVHLVQGNMNDLNVAMKIHLRSSEEVEKCEIRGNKSSKDVIIQLPPWSVSSGDNYHSHMEKVRNSFHGVISVALEQAKCLKEYAIAFSTAQLSKSFPASVIAKGIVEILYEQTGLNLASSQTENKNVNIYICDPGNEAVFNAFKFFLKLRQANFVLPSQVAWGQVCFPDSYTYPDYNNLKSRGIQIEVASKIPFSLGNNSCVFYPIHPSLEFTTCPAFREQPSAERSLKSSLIDLKREKPDGLVVGETVPLKGFFDGRNYFVYCSPDWGVSCDQDIDRILKNCLKTSGPCDVLYIIPPGMQMLSKYPVGYLAQIFFRKLDGIIQNKIYLLQKKKCVLLVQDVEYRKAFDQELQKRYPKTAEKTGLLHSLLNLFKSSEQEEDTTNVRKTVLKKSHVQDTEIVVCGMCEVDIQKTVMDLEKHLFGLMKDNTETRILSKEDTHRFLKKVHNIHSDVQVFISLQECYDMKKRKSKKNKGAKGGSDNMILSSSILRIQGLQKNFVDEFLVDIGLEKEHGNSAKNKASLRKPSVPLENLEDATEKETCVPFQASVKSTENTNSVEGNVKQQKKPRKSEQESAISSMLLQGSYKWLCESCRQDSFEMVNFKIEKDIEDAYIKGNEQLELSGDITQVDFKSMTVMKKNTKRSIIRTEVLDTGKQYSLPKSAKLTKVEDNTEDHRHIMKILDNCIKNYKLFLVEVSKVPKDYLHIRFEWKCADLKDKNFSWMWHRTLPNCKQYVCRYGFHPKFSGMPDATNLGEGVLFYSEPEMFFNPETKTEGEIHLVYSKVYIGRSCPGAPKLRCLSSDEKTGERFDSVSEGGSFMIFSDTQACPEFLITLKFI